MNLLQQVYTEGRLLRHNWAKTDEQGRKLMCLYVALAGGDASTTTPTPTTRRLASDCEG